MNDYLEFSGKCSAIQYDIEKQVICYKNSVGDVADCYKKIILDKCYSLSKIQGEFYYKKINETVKLQTLIEKASPQMPEADWLNLVSSISVAR